jgi:hypothetical protein
MRLNKMADVKIKPISQCPVSYFLKASDTPHTIESFAALLSNVEGFLGSPLYKKAIDKCSILNRKIPTGGSSGDNGFQGMGTFKEKQSSNDDKITILCIDGSEVTISRRLLCANDGD